jgi:hypothetical protein
MINLFLRAKHWQLFLLFFAFPFVMQFIALGGFLSTIPFHIDHEPEPELILGLVQQLFKWLPFIILPTILGFAGWLWSISVGLHNKLPEGHGLNLTLFKWCIILPIIIIIAIFYSLSNIFSEVTTLIETQGEIEEVPTWIGQFFLLFPLVFLSVGCSIYTYYHTAKTIKLVEKGNTQRKPEFIGEFFLIWFYFIGVWILQPKINRMQEDDYVTPELDESKNQPTRYDN